MVSNRTAQFALKFALFYQKKNRFSVMLAAPNKYLSVDGIPKNQSKN